MNPSDERLIRVREMEERYDELAGALARLEEAVSALQTAEPGLEALRAYMDSGQWREDFEADERGEIPAEVKRGVLSEDGLFDLLQEADRALELIR
jgi:hypothetical protein